ncbi:MAG: sugar-transfer associated ATP-grasp domain-containing protein [Anaerovoracaceae bacterium]|jgi:hypothetical protein
MISKIINFFRSDGQAEQNTGMESGTPEEPYLRSVMRQTGWTREEAENRMVSVREEYGVTFREFCHYDLYSVPVENMAEEVKKIREQKDAEEKEDSRHISSVLAKTGWDFRRVTDDMTDARDRFGISFFEYDYYDFHRFSGDQRKRAAKDVIKGRAPVDQELKERFEAIDSAGGTDLKQAGKRAVLSVMEKTGWDAEKALAEMRRVKAEAGVSFPDYDKFDFFRIPEKYHENVAEYAKDGHEIWKLVRRTNISAVVLETGCSYLEAESVIKAANLKYGINSGQFHENSFYYAPDEERVEIAAKCRVNSIRSKQRRQNINDRKYRAIMQAAGWTYEEAVEHYLDAFYRTGVRRGDYLSYRMYDMTPAQQESLLLPSYSRKLRLRYNKDPEFHALVRDKEASNNFFNEYLKRKWCVNTKVTEEEFREIFRGVDKVIYKPIRGTMGKGVQSFDLKDGMKEVYAGLKRCPIGIVEEYIVQHPVLAGLSSSSVNTLRIVTVSSSSEPVTADGKMMDIAYAALRIGGGTALVDNIHSGGMAVSIDLDTGTIATDAVDNNGAVYPEHPLTGVHFKGLEVPFFRESLDFVTEIIKTKNVEGYYGWDIAVSEQGPLFLELNSNPGVVLLTAPYAPLKIGKKYVMEKYMY